MTDIPPPSAWCSHSKCRSMVATKVAIVKGLGQNICHSSPAQGHPKILGDLPGHRSFHRLSDKASQAFLSIKVPLMKDRIAKAAA